ncbi:hypothetical protein N4G40_17140 [Pantoea eucrina]|uniref:Uncharacterized protein n=1 Tax=Pantoea eucrina TaxID=472693 RepID=A0ABU5LJ59_9GAMM|nr:hypothetical protein [Pantoea eucrina]MDZ7279979.1 hypothetical protein [Pantoea eucrina]
MNALHLQNLYRATNENTLNVWRQNAGIGNVKEDDQYDPSTLALATSIRPALSAAVTRLIDELAQCTQRDPLADTLPANGFHFTFVPVTLPRYRAYERLPAEVDHLKQIWVPFHGVNIAIRHLRLVALPNQLLLAGIPDAPAIALRQSFCDQVLDSYWKNALLQRHTGRPLPAPFWHSTLLRYRADFLPASVRRFFLTRQHVNVGDVAGALTLAKVSYNWTTCYSLID